MIKRRTPVILQLNAVECGAACLAMILGYFGRKARLEECRSKCDPGRDGVSAQTIVAAARDFGLRTRALSLSPGGLAEVNLPCIVYWKNNHFVVLERWSRDNPHERLGGLGAIVESPQLAERGKQPYWPETRFILAGFLPDGRQLRISWFEDFRVDSY